MPWTGPKINLPRALIKAGYRCPSDNAYYPQGTVSCLYQLKTQIPVDFDVVAHGDERSLARSHLCALKAADVVVYDRGYYSYEMLYEHAVRGLHAVFRVKRRAAAAFKRFMASAETDATVVIRPQCGSVRAHPQSLCKRRMCADYSASGQVSGGANRLYTRDYAAGPAPIPDLGPVGSVSRPLGD